MKRFVAVLNKKVEPGRIMNALAHMALGYSALYPNKEELLFESYFDKDGGEHPSISDYPFIVLSSDNSNQIRTLRNALKERNIVFNDFTSAMVEGTAEEQRERNRQTPELELEYYGICFFGEEEKFKELTKRFSLWR
jgi:hypothetical protein